MTARGKPPASPEFAAGGDFYRVVASWPQMFRTIVFLFVFFALFFTGIAVSLRVFRSSGISIRSGASGTTIQFDEIDRTLRFDTILVAPQDWNDPDISVKKGDRLTVKAFGRVNIAAGLMNQALEIQYAFRAENAANGLTRDVRKMKAEQVRASQLTVPWCGPEGIVSDTVIRADVKETQDREAESRILPHERMGRLIAAITPDDSCPRNGRTSPDMQLMPYDGEATYHARISGHLCFIINDHRSDDGQINHLFWDDNIGFFTVNLRIETK